MKRFLGFICFVYVFIIIYVWTRGLLNNYISPNMQIFIKISIIPLLFMGIVFIFNKKIDYKFKISDIVLLLPLLMILLAGDGNLSLNLASNRMAISNEDRSKDEINIMVEDKKYDFDNVDYEIIDNNFSELASYLTFNKNGILNSGKTIRVKGFSVTNDPAIPNGLFAIGRYFISCCTADASFVGFYSKYDLSKIKNNTWYEIEGVLRNGKDTSGYNILYIDVINIKEISSENQYIYSCYSYGDGKCEDVKKYNLKY